MNDSESLGVLATLREVTELLAGLDLTTLPPIWGVQVSPMIREDALTGRAQLASTFPTEREAIDAIRSWAVALGAVVLLGDEVTHARGSYRQLAAVLRLPSGALFEVWDHLSDLHPSPEWTPADLGMITIPLDRVS